MNHLSKETSPYLLQHAHNPVEWYAWKEEAFERARREDKPILVSIGYSTCHWCHVMERESFENEEVAAFMNEHFINIKVDREERPDVDQIYMEACQAISGSGGWPLNCFLTPDQKPFFAGTYFPPRPAHQLASWIQVLQNIYRAFTQKRSEVEDQANRLLQTIEKSGSILRTNNIADLEGKVLFDRAWADQLFDNLKIRFDRQEGGFGAAPKFPGTMVLSFLMEYYYHSQEQEALDHVFFSLDKMIQGGIYDQLGGGFARYATDRAWLIPHFEKMLYDNALMIGVLSDAWKISRKSIYRETIEETLGYVSREMSAPEGGFYAALDADSEGVEGLFYIWDKTEVEHVLGEEAALFCSFYDVTDTGNWEEKNILWRAMSYEDFAASHGMEEEVLRKRLAASREKLFGQRAQRIRPGLDDKQLLSWNALMIKAYAQAYLALGEESYKTKALKDLTFVLEKFQQTDQVSFFHTYKNGVAQYPAFLTDYAFLIEALLAVYQISYEPAFLEKASSLVDFLIAEFSDEVDPLFFFTQKNQKDIPIRRKETYDSALPSGNSTMAANLRHLGVLLDRTDYLERNEQMLLSLKTGTEKYPTSFARWASAMLDLAFQAPEVAVVGEKAFSVAQEIQQKFIPGLLLMASREENENFPLLKSKPIKKDTYIYVCQNYTCQKPVKNLEEFEQLI